MSKNSKNTILRKLFGVKSRKLTMIEADFPIQVPEISFVQQTYNLLEPMGFDRYNALPCVCLCRDELTVAMLNLIDEVWSYGPDDNQSFIMHSLGGLVFLGKTGLLAAMHHAPRDDSGKERYIFYCFPHIGFNDQGVPGKVRRHGIKEESGACGALIAFAQELQSGYVNLEIDPDDVEQSLLKQRLIKRLKFGQAPPSLADMTKIAHEVALEDLERLISLTVDSDVKKKDCDYAVFTGVQINGGGRDNYIWPSVCYAVVNGQKTVFKPEDWDVTIAEAADEKTTITASPLPSPSAENPESSTRNDKPGVDIK